MSSDSLPKPGKTVSAVGDWFNNPSLANANAVAQTGDQSLQNTSNFFNKEFMPGPPPDPQLAGAAPNSKDATMAALRSQLQEELKMRASATLFAGNTPTTMSAGQSLAGGF